MFGPQNMAKLCSAAARHILHTVLHCSTSQRTAGCLWWVALVRSSINLPAGVGELASGRNTKVLYWIVLYCIVLYCIVLYCIVLYCIVLYCMVLYCFVLYCIVLYCIVLYCIVLYYTVLQCSAVHSAR